MTCFCRYYDPGEETEAFCQMYRGAACSKYLENKSIYVNSKYQQGQMEERLTGKVLFLHSSNCAILNFKEKIPAICPYFRRYI